MSDTLVNAEVYPSGITVAYHEDRLTKAGKPRVRPLRWYEVNDERVPSVTEILGVLHKDALTWWGQHIGVKGVLELDRRGFEPMFLNDEDIMASLTAEKLTVNHIRDAAGKRGQGAHDALHAFATEGTIPSLRDYPSEDRGYVQGLASFLLTEKPEFISAEVVVGSAEYGYAGRYDLRVRLDGREGIVDLKTSREIWSDSQMPQVAAYAHAAEECGEAPTDFEAILRVGSGGSYELRQSCAGIEHFLGAKAAFDAQRSLRERVKEAKKAVAA
jgi:hypothetical protein